MKQVLFDTNIILDIVLQRSPFAEDAVQIFHLIDNQIIKGYITVNSVTDIYYLVKKEKGHQYGIAFIADLINVVQVLEVHQSVIKRALDSKMKDFEDAIQEVCAQKADLDIIVTRNQSDFTASKLLVFNASDAFRYLMA